MSSSFVPANSEAQPADTTISNDGFFPDLSLLDFDTALAVSGLSIEEKSTHLQSAMLEVNAILATWKSAQTGIASLADVPGIEYGEKTDKEIHYQDAVHYMAKGMINATARDYDTTKSGHDKSDLQKESTPDYMQLAQTHISRIMGRAKVQVELI